MIAGLNDYMILVSDHSGMLFLPQRHEDTKVHKAFAAYGPLCVPSCLCAFVAILLSAPHPRPGPVQPLIM
jgi:hypothetical protein